jgi:CHAT domain
VARPAGDLVAQTIAAYREATEVSAAAPMLRAEAAMEWGRVAAQHGDWAVAEAGFSVAIALFPLISPRHFARTDQEHQLALFSGLASDAAACVLASGRPDPLRAVALLEQGRGVLIGHMLGNSADLTRVRASNPTLAREFEQLRDDFDVLASDQSQTDLSERRAEVQRRRDQVITQIRALDDLADFLREPSGDRLLRAGAAGPVVMVNISRYRCDALIVSSDGVDSLPLPLVTAAEVASLTVRYLELLDRMGQPGQPYPHHQRGDSADMRDICGWLWDRLARPVLDKLGLPPRDSGWPRIWWCPTGALTLLPLHAAHRHDPSRDVDTGVADRAVSSYTTTLRTLIAVRSRLTVESGNARPLVVALADTRGLPHLSQVDREIGVLAATHPKVLKNHAATRVAVRSALTRHPWFHFAGHSCQDLLEPALARLCLHDGDLTALAITQLQLVQGELAYLSSCESAIAGTKVPDEPLHLALAFQVAGYRHVIATLWPVSDLVAAKVAEGVYRRITRHGRIDCSQVALALHETVVELRARYPAEVWAAYLHAGA